MVVNKVKLIIVQQALHCVHFAFGTTGSGVHLHFVDEVGLGTILCGRI